MRTKTWLDDEPGFLAGCREAVILLGRGARRPIHVLALSLFFASSLVGVAHVLRPAYAPRFVLRVTEMNRDPSTMARPKRQLAEYVREAVLTSDVLMRLLKRHGLYGSLASKNPQAALDSFREDIEVDAYQNYFVEERSASEAPRSARLAIRFRSRDAAQALAVTRDLGNTVVERERDARNARAKRALDAASDALERAERALADRRLEVLEKKLEIGSSQEVDPLKEVELVSLLGSLEPRERRVVEANGRKAALGLGAALERQGVSMRFEVVDDGSVPAVGEILRRRLKTIFFGALLAILPFSALAVGAFSKRGVT